VGNPWSRWIPGVLSKGQITELCNAGLITGEGSLEEAIDESSIDLSLSDEAYRMIKGSVKPSASDHYGWFIKNNGLAEKLEKSEDGSYVLKAKETYVFKLREQLQKRLSDAQVHGQATAKSSVGRVDVLARLIVNGMDTYETFDPGCLERQNGDMYLEITPITFSVRVKEGICLSQLRLYYGRPEDVEIRSDRLFRTVLQGPGANAGCLTVDLANVTIGGVRVAAFCATPPTHPNDTIPLWVRTEEGRPEPWKYWKFIATDETERLKIEQTQFYLLRSKEKISVPEGIAIYCRASDETIGEMRIHYAGFVHPQFGWRRHDERKGTPLIFEVRGHQVDVSLADGEKMANLKFYRMSQDSKGEGPPSTYEGQSLKLSKFFDEWPEKLRGSTDGTVEPIH